LYDDTRRFGRVEILDRDAWNARDRSLGAEPLAPSFTGATLYGLTSASRSPIRNWLLDQNRIA
ncbi:MAG: formamidopyrimidine-DNA glycosylase, partial [Gemmatimonadetes bacterium]|nr:formamidopyrimidine-DNA glycosylase [Gemmatimonadota bacterium]NIQ54035.1 formamidopyrimidine-DNA glycosylase [Gemmatimonadota bacterium]NIU74219.1 formamidopyrimidine-DNA glycosylase [Gammaproteobacteria bacterium]NIX44247.1 formamidopyrimidine-DNA glycosylase [Gemmatimonadota bacterium]